jgi:hypothetical protein
MKPTLVAVVSLGTLAGLFAVPRDAHALGPVGIEIGAKAGFGTQPSNTDTNFLGFGLGGRGGVTFMNIYAGVNVLYYFGGSDTYDSYHSLMYGVEAGYGFKLLDLLTIRPQIGVGNFALSVSPSGGGSGTGYNNLYLEPGVTGLIGLGTFFVGVDANLLVLPGVYAGPSSTNTDTAFTLHGQVGVQF